LATRGRDADFALAGNLLCADVAAIQFLVGTSVRPKRRTLELIELNAQGRFPFEKLVKFYSLDQINQAAKDSENGGTIKPIIRLM